MAHLWPQITFLSLSLIGVGVALAKYGEKKVTTYNWTDFAASAITLTILYFGGFFSPLGLAP